MSTWTTLDVDHITNGGGGLPRIMDLESSTEVLEYLIIQKVSRTEEFVEFGSGPFSNIGGKEFRDRMSRQEWIIHRGSRKHG
jgi:hypothetical protein